MSDDGELLARYVARGAEAEEAFATLVQRHIDLVYSAALRRLRGDAHAATDITQQVFVALARRAPRFGRDVALPAWLFATTRNLAVDLIRRESSRRAREQEVAAMSDQSGEELVVNWEQASPLLDAAMDDLRETERAVVVLRFFAQRSFAEVGRMLGVSEDAARMRVDRALEKLRLQLARRGVASTSAALVTALGANAAHPAPVGLAAAVSGVALSGGLPSAGAFAGLLVVVQTKWAAAMLGTMALLASGFAVREVVAQGAREAEVARLEQVHAQFRAQLAERERQASVAERELEEAKAARRRSVAAATKAAGTAAALVVASEEPAKPRNAIAEADAMMARHPAIRQAILGWHVAKMKFRYAPLFSALGLTSSQIDTFVELVRGENLFGEWGPHREFLEFRVPREPEVEATRDQRLRELLGQDGYRIYLDLYRVQDGREYAGQLASLLALSDTPLTPAQANKLVPVLASVRYPSRHAEGNWDEVIAKASLDLAPAQVATLRSIFEWERKSAASTELKRTIVEAADESR